MNPYNYKNHDIIITCTIILSMLFGILLSMIFSKSFNQNFLIPVVTIKKPYHQNSNTHGNQKSVTLKIESQNYPKFSVPVKMTLGKIKKIENPYRPRLNLTFVEHDRIFETHTNLEFMVIHRLNIDYELF
tara:strand:+ start:1072 stop:1461 length:390 start_codon:yes stop_codon:yes gene_type:complete